MLLLPIVLQAELYDEASKTGESSKNKQLFGRWLQPRYIGLVYALFLTIVLTKIGNLAVKPSFNTLDKHVALGVKSEFINQIEPDEQVCLLGKHFTKDYQNAPKASFKYTFFYSSYFHPELDYSYSVKAAFNPESCGNLKMIPDNIDLDP